MPALRKFLILLTLSGPLLHLNAGDFARHVAGDGFLYVEFRDLPGWQERFGKTSVSGKLRELDWKKIVLQFYRIGLTSGVNQGNPQEEAFSPDTLLKNLTDLEFRWRELRRHLNGDVAFSMGNFKEVIPVFRENAAIREALALTHDEIPEGGELTDEQIEEQARWMKEEAGLDAREINSLLGQFRIMADVKDAEILETRLAAWLDERVKASAADNGTPLSLSKTEMEGKRLYQLGLEGDASIPGLHWAIHDNVIVLTLSREALVDALRKLASPPEDALALQPAFRDGADYVGAADTLVYFNLAPLDPLIRNLLSELPEPQSDPIPFIGQLPTGKAVLDWLDLTAMQPYVLGSRLEGESVRSRGRYGFKRESPLSRIMIDPENKPAEVPGFIHREFSQFAAFNWHPGNGWSRLERELMGIVPQAAAAMGLGRMLAAGQVGFDLKLQFTDHLDGNMLMVQTIDPEVVEKLLKAGEAGDPAEIMKVQMSHPTGGSNYLFAMGMKNEEAIREAFNRLMNRFHPAGVPGPVKLDGRELFYPVPEGFQGGRFHKLVSYAYVDGYFLLAVGDDQLLKDAVKASGNPALQMVNDPEFTSIRGKLPANASSIEYSSAEQRKNALRMIQSTLSMFQSADPELELPDLGPLTEMLDQSLTVTVRNGLMFEIDGLLEFQPAE